MSDSPVIGVDVDPLRPVAVRGNANDDAVTDPDPLSDFPPGLLRPVVSYAPSAVDHRNPAAIDGSGVDRGRAPWERRIPIGYAIEQMLAEPESALRFRESKKSGRSSVAEELGRAAVHLARQVGTPEPQRSIALVVPNAIQESTQEALLRGMRRASTELQRRDQPVLVWRPVAAALEWIERHGGALPCPKGDRTSLGTLLHLHLGIESFEATELELLTCISKGQVWIVPGRRQPATDDLLIETPLSQLEEVVLGSRQLPANGPNERALIAWHASWLTPLLDHSMSATNGRWSTEPLPRWLPAGLANDIGDRLLERIRSHTPSSHRSWGPLPPATAIATSSIETWRQSLRQYGSGKCVGVVLTGPIAGLRSEAGEPFGLSFATWLRLPREKVLLEATDQPGLLAFGACRFARRRLRGDPTYLDTLPEVSTIATIRGEPTWRNLLQGEDRWVPGGVTWRGQPRDIRFQIDRGQRELELVVHREGSATCRKVGIQFESPTTEACPVQLRVEVEPGQGNPRVEVVPEQPRLFRGRRLHLDWLHATDSGRSKADELQAVPRAFPPLEPRLANRWLWTEKQVAALGIFDVGLRAVVIDYLAAPLRWQVGRSPRDLEVLRRWFWFRSKPRRNETGAAVTSDGVPASVLDDRFLLDRFVLSLVNRIRGAELAEQRTLLRILGSTSTAHEVALALLRELLGAAGRVPDRLDRWPILYACGNCFRSAADVDRLFRHFERTQLPDYVDADSLALPLLYREKSLEQVETVRVERWLGKLIKLLESAPIGLRRVKLDVSRAALGIAYVLRRRAFDNGFLAPGSRLHVEVRDSVTRVRRPSRPDDTPSVAATLENLDRIVGYIDRKGAGRLTGLLDDEGESEADGDE